MLAPVQMELFEESSDLALEAAAPALPVPPKVSNSGPKKTPAFVGWMVVQDGPGTQQWKWGKGYVDAIICWGSGFTGPAALRDSLRWISTSEGLTHIETVEHILEDVRFNLRRCTRAAMAHLNEYGSDFDFVVINGKILLKDEAGN